MLPCCVRELTPLNCKQSPCPCRKCQLKREAAAERAQCPLCNKKNCELANSPMKFLHFCIEFVGNIAMLIIAVSFIWINILVFTVKYGEKLYKSKKNRTIVGAIIGAIVFGIAYSFAAQKIKHFLKFRKCKIPSPSPILKQACEGKTFDKLNCCLKKTNIPTPPKPPAYCPKVKQQLPVLTDKEAREMFRVSRLYAIPTEMKQPPALLTYLYNTYYCAQNNQVS